MGTVIQFPVPAVPASDWLTIGARAARCRTEVAVSPEDVQKLLGTPVGDLLAFEAGEPVISVYEIEGLATMLGTHPGAWFCGDEAPLFRGADSSASKEATDLGTSLMADFLAAEARSH